MLLIDYSSAFNTIVPTRLVLKLRSLRLNTTLCNWILDGQTPGCENGQTHLSVLTLSSPLLYALYTHDFVATHGSNTILKFTDDTTILGLINNNDETAYREEVRDLATWCQGNNLSLNVCKTKEMIVPPAGGGCNAPLHIDGAWTRWPSLARRLKKETQEVWHVCKKKHKFVQVHHLEQGCQTRIRPGTSFYVARESL